MLKILIADDHVIFREGLCALFSTHKDITISAVASNGKEAIGLIEKVHPDIAILDISMPQINGIEVAEMLSKQRDLKTKIILLSMHDNLVDLNTLASLNISGFVLKENAFDDLCYAIKKVAEGEVFISPSLLAKRQALGQKVKITPREKEIISLIASGLTNKEIASKLDISINTVETHRSSLMQKLNAHNTAMLIKQANKLGLL